MKVLQPYSTVTCPRCGHKSREEMPDDACISLYQCLGCGVLLKPDGGGNEGRCACIYCLYGDVPCPPVQLGQDGCS